MSGHPSAKSGRTAVDQRLFNYIYRHQSICQRPFKDCRWLQRHSLFLSADPLFVCSFVGVVNFVTIPEFLAIECKYRSWEILNTKLYSEIFLPHFVIENIKGGKSFLLSTKPSPTYLPQQGSCLICIYCMYRQGPEAETTFHYCWRIKSSFKLAWKESISTCNSLIVYSLKYHAAAHWSDQNLLDKIRFRPPVKTGSLPQIVHLVLVSGRITNALSSTFFYSVCGVIEIESSSLRKVEGKAKASRPTRGS